LETCGFEIRVGANDFGDEFSVLFRPVGVCSDAAVGQTTGRLGLTDLMKLLREQHPGFSQKGDRGEQLTRILKAFSAICDVLNQIRNDASLAHPNEQLLDYTDAMLAVNAARTILHYVHGKLQSQARLDPGTDEIDMADQALDE
jgi:hypothetical protein